ncbi:2'-phosphotransferase [Durusdinium trenchii]|uniref:2'-phosphotransferase n=1 Tax=Durusdinium trenchii TaxID=1381693 RepID=A0ABP0LP43_9DINO
MRPLNITGLPSLPPAPGMPPGVPPGPGVPAGVAPGVPGVPPGVPPGVLQGLPPGMPGMPPLSAGMPGVPPGLRLPSNLPNLPGLNLPTLPGLAPNLGNLVPNLVKTGPPVRAPQGPGAGGTPGGGLDTESLAQLRFQQVAAEYEQIKTAGVDPQVTELAEHFGLDERVTRLLDEEMKKRRKTFEEDLQALWVGLEGAKNPAGMVMMRLKDMRNGIFRGMSAMGKKVQEYAKRYRLDTQAGIRLAEVLEQREDPDGDLAKIARHLERSNKPSSLVMMMLRDLRDGKPVKARSMCRRL